MLLGSNLLLQDLYYGTTRTVTAYSPTPPPAPVSSTINVPVTRVVPTSPQPVLVAATAPAPAPAPAPVPKPTCQNCAAKPASPAAPAAERIASGMAPVVTTGTQATAGAGVVKADVTAANENWGLLLLLVALGFGLYEAVKEKRKGGAR